MKRVKQPLLGLCPIGKFVFSHEDAMRYKRLIMDRFDRWGIGYVHLDGVLPDGMVRDQRHVEPAVRYFLDHRVDGLFIPHCNFGTEGAAAMIARQCRVPVLLWGPRDDAPPGRRHPAAGFSVRHAGHQRSAAQASRSLQLYQ